MSGETPSVLCLRSSVCFLFKYLMQNQSRKKNHFFFLLDQVFFTIFHTSFPEIPEPKRQKEVQDTRLGPLSNLIPDYVACKLYCMVVKQGDISAEDAEQYC